MPRNLLPSFPTVLRTYWLPQASSIPTKIRIRIGKISRRYAIFKGFIFFLPQNSSPVLADKEFSKLISSFLFILVWRRASPSSEQSRRRDILSVWPPLQDSARWPAPPGQLTRVHWKHTEQVRRDCTAWAMDQRGRFFLDRFFLELYQTLLIPKEIFG